MVRAACLAVCSLLAAASPSSAAQVIAEDLSVQGSQCVGIDCTNAETFGFDTLRLKENNLRIKFEDTSASAGYPSLDWELMANESASGGRDMFSLRNATDGRSPFSVMGAAPEDALFVAGDGNLGLGTETPLTDIHAVAADTPAIRLEQSGGPPTAQTWDILGRDTDFALRDLTRGSRLPLRVSTGAPTDALRVQGSGDVTTVGALSQTADPAAREKTAAPDAAAILRKVKALPLQRYELTADPADAAHLGPTGRDFRAAFGLGSSDELIAPADMGGVSLVAIKALVNRVESLERAGSRGPAGTRGPAGPAGSPASAKTIRSLKARNRKQDKRLKALERKLRRLMRSR